MVQRYDLVIDDLRQIVESEDGYFVEYEDYAALKADRDYWYEKCLDAGLLDEEAEMDATKRARVFNE